MLLFSISPTPQFQTRENNEEIKNCIKKNFDDLEKRWFQSIRDNFLKNDSIIFDFYK